MRQLFWDKEDYARLRDVFSRTLCNVRNYSIGVFREIGLKSRGGELNTWNQGLIRKAEVGYRWDHRWMTDTVGGFEE